jgi:hypothetical protein
LSFPLLSFVRLSAPFADESNQPSGIGRIVLATVPDTVAFVAAEQLIWRPLQMRWRAVN